MSNKDNDKDKQPTIGDIYVVAKMSGLVRDRTLAKALGLPIKTIKEIRKGINLGRNE